MKEVFKSSFVVHKKAVKHQEFHWEINSLSNGFIQLEIDEGCTDLKLFVQLKEDAKFELFVLNHAKETCSLEIQMELNANAHCKMGLLDLEDSNLNWKQLVCLKQEGAEFEILSGQLCLPSIHKVGDIEVKHEAGHTFGQIRNFAVLSDDSVYEMQANGNILKGCHEANSHQATRVLTLGKGHKAKVTPLLLIDENNVKASHALSIGQPDEEQLYYLRSRGLTVSQSLGLLSIGYFLPVIEMVRDESLKLALREEMEGKVGLYGGC